MRWPRHKVTETGVTETGVTEAVATNLLPIVIPCHRVLPRSGDVGTYATRSFGRDAGKIKRRLLDLAAGG